ncbi:MAG: OB-fold putative lipoprotein [Pyrinomonadaceae bacterium]|nr:OB-fold putative lipoprotein [Pyrinomonadaceae bacterium]
MKNTISILATIFIFSLILGCGFGENKENSRTETNTQPTPTNKKEETKSENSVEKPIRSTELVDVFKKDKDGANAKYKGKTIQIIGKITNINDVFGTKALNLRDSEAVMGLQTYLENNDEVKKVKVGDEVVVRGKVRGDGTDVIDNAFIVKVN